MNLLLTVQDLSKSHGSTDLFSKISFSLYRGDKMGLTGPNGAGKSTLLKIIFGEEGVNGGTIAKKSGVTIGYASQFPQFSDLSVKEILLENGNSHEDEVEAEILLDKAGFADKEQSAKTLSGGWKKRLDVLRVIMQKPDLILLDEPTNHLDLEGILWLEAFLQKERAAFLIVSHDRCFLEKVCTKILEINKAFPSGTFLVEGNWKTFVERRKEFLEGQIEKQRSLAGVLRGELEWMRRSPKARTTKSKSRVDRAEGMVKEFADLSKRNEKKRVNLSFSASERETKSLIITKNLSKSMGEKELFRGVDVKLSPGSRLGIVGENGTGKTTLLRILAGEISPDMGTVKYAQDLKLTYFDQLRETIDDTNTLKEALSPNGDFVKCAGKEVHVHGFAERFLFPKERLNMPVSALSGGERARILIARLILKEADVLFLDEPTNDLDIPTLEVLEKSLIEFPGAVVLITHDRYLMDRVCTSILGLGEGKEGEIFAGYSQWEKRAQKKVVDKKKEKLAPKARVKKISYKEKKELEGMEEAIAKAESELHQAEKLAQEKGHLQPALYQELAAKEQELERLYTRWQELLDLNQG